MPQYKVYVNQSGLDANYNYVSKFIGETGSLKQVQQ